MRLFAVGSEPPHGARRIAGDASTSRAAGSRRRWPRSRRAASAVRWSCCRRATAPRSMRVGDTDATADGVGRFFSEYHKIPHDADAPSICMCVAVRMRRAICSASPPDSTRWSSASRRFSARSRRRTRAASDAQFTGRADQPPVPFGVRRRQARARRDRARRRGGVGQLCGDRAGEEDLRRPEGTERARSSAPARWRS